MWHKCGLRRRRKWRTERAPAPLPDAVGANKKSSTPSVVSYSATCHEACLYICMQDREEDIYTFIIYAYICIYTFIIYAYICIYVCVYNECNVYISSSLSSGYPKRSRPSHLRDMRRVTHVSRYASGHAYFSIVRHSLRPHTLESHVCLCIG